MKRWTYFDGDTYSEYGHQLW